MSLIDAINKFIVGKLHRNRQQVFIDGDNLVVGQQRLRLHDVRGIAAFEADIYAGTLMALALSFDSAQTLTMTEQDASWNELLSALDRNGLTSKPSSAWLAELMAGGGKDGALILRR